MADLDARIVPKASGAASEVPTSTDLLVGEIAINTADGYAFVKHTDNTIKTLGRDYIGELLDVSNTAPSDGNSLKWSESNQEWQPGSVTVENLANITIDDLQTNQVLQWNGTLWENAYPDISQSTTRDLSDVSAVAPLNGQGLQYNSVLGEYEPKAFFNNPLTTQGDIIIQFGGQAARLGIGTSGQVLIVSGGGVPAWSDPVVSGSIDQLTDVDISTTPPVNGDLLVWNSANQQFEPDQPTFNVEGSLSDLDDVSSTPPSDGQGLVWDEAGGVWGPGDVASVIEWSLNSNGSVSYIFSGPGFAGTEQNPTLYLIRGQSYKIVNPMGVHPFQVQSTEGVGGTVYSEGITNNGVSNGTLEWEVRMDSPSTLYYQCTAHSPMAGTIKVLDGTGSGDGGSGGGSGAGIYLQESQLASGGAANFTGLGYSGILQKVESDLDAWVVLYTTEAARTADATRAFGEDPQPGSGVLFEAYVSAGGTVAATPGTTYMNDDTDLTEAVYAAVRDQAGAAVGATVTFYAYGLAAITSVSGGTFGSG